MKNTGNITNLHFPAYFPPGCPPQEAENDEIDLFRVCDNDEPREEDFLSFYQLGKCKDPNDHRCYGLSVFPTNEDCLSAARKSPALRAKKSIAKGHVTRFHGVHLQTSTKNNPKHITWWLYDGVMPHKFFTRVSLIKEVKL